MTTENHPNRQLYREIKNRIRTVDKEGDFIRFSESLYVGGKKGTEYGRQMILSDLIEYIFFGRGVYFVKDTQTRKIFIEILLNTINLLLIIDSMTVNAKLRKKFLDSLPHRIGKSFFKNEDMRLSHQALSAYQWGCWLFYEVKKYS